ncbi:MAG: hypothetical protein DSZ12_06290, partial [Sulfurovum sp.]
MSDMKGKPEALQARELAHCKALYPSVFEQRDDSNLDWFQFADRESWSGITNVGANMGDTGP